MRRQILPALLLSLLIACGTENSGGPGDTVTPADLVDIVAAGDVLVPWDAQPDSLDSADLSPTDTADEVDAVPLPRRPGALQPPQVTVLAEGTHTIDTTELAYQLVRLDAPGEQATYVQWVPAPAAGIRPTVVLTQPYDVIDWTGEAQDADAAKVVAPMTPETGVEAGWLYLLHDFNVLLLYGRFYTGGDLDNEVHDMTAGLAFLASREKFDSTRVGIFGGSWGGFEALYSAAYSLPEARPTVGVALAPLGDFALQVRYSVDTVAGLTNPDARTMFENFFAPYIERIYATTGGHPDNAESDYTFWTAPAVADRLVTPFLVVHDSWDALVPFDSSAALVELAPDRVEPLWILHHEPIDFNEAELNHYLTLGDFQYPAIYTIATAHLIGALADPAQANLVLYDPEALAAFVDYVREFQLAGVPMDWAAPRLLDFGRPEVTLFDVTETAAPVDGASWLADRLAQTWGLTDVAPSDLPQLLADGLPD